MGSESGSRATGIGAGTQTMAAGKGFGSPVSGVKMFTMIPATASVARTTANKKLMSIGGNNAAEEI